MLHRLTKAATWLALTVCAYAQAVDPNRNVPYTPTAWRDDGYVIHSRDGRDVSISGNVTIGATLPGAATAAGTVAVWAKYSCDVSTNAGFWTCNGTKGAALTAGLSQQVALVTLPAKTVVHAIVIEHTAAFSGTSITAVTASVGTATVPTLLSDAYNVFQAASADPYENGGLKVGRRTASTLALIVAVTSTGANISALTVGSVNVYLLTSVLP